MTGKKTARLTLGGMETALGAIASVSQSIYDAQQVTHEADCISCKTNHAYCNEERCEKSLKDFPPSEHSKNGNGGSVVIDMYQRDDTGKHLRDSAGQKIPKKCFLSGPFQIFCYISLSTTISFQVENCTAILPFVRFL